MSHIVSFNTDYLPINRLCITAFLSAALIVNSPTTHAENFGGTTLFDLSRKLSEATGYTILFSPRIRLAKEIKVYAPDDLTNKELYNVFLTVLEMHGYVGFKRDNIIRIVRERRARTLPLEVVQ